MAFSSEIIQRALLALHRGVTVRAKPSTTARHFTDF